VPSVSGKQHKFMEAVAHNPSFAKKVGVPQSVGKEFSNADKGKTFKRGGEMASKMDPKMMAMMAKKRAAPAAPAAPGAGMMAMKKGGSVKGLPTSMSKVRTAAPSRDGVASKGKTKGTMVKMSKGGRAC
jgi:hypothetical protein